MHTFETPDPVNLYLHCGGGHVTVRSEPTDRTTVELTPLEESAHDVIAEATVVQNGDAVSITIPRKRGLFRSAPRVAIEVVVPETSSIDVRAEACDVRASGSYHHARVVTGAGLIAVESVSGSCRLKSGSGAVSAGQVDGPLDVDTGSGDVSLDRVSASTSVSVGSGHISIGDLTGTAVARTGSGDVEIGILQGALTTKTGSGDLVVRRAASGELRSSGASGRVSIGVPEGTAAWLDLSTVSGRVSQELHESGGPREDQRQVEITAHTVSGDLRVHRS